MVSSISSAIPAYLGSLQPSSLKSVLAAHTPVSPITTGGKGAVSASLPNGSGLSPEVLSLLQGLTASSSTSSDSPTSMLAELLGGSSNTEGDGDYISALLGGNGSTSDAQASQFSKAILAQVSRAAYRAASAGAAEKAASGAQNGNSLSSILDGYNNAKAGNPVATDEVA